MIGTASTSFHLAIATSTRQTNNAADCCSILRLANNGSATTTAAGTAIFDQPAYLFKYRIGTGTIGSIFQDYKWVGSTTPKVVVRQGQYLDLVLMDASLSVEHATPARCVGNNLTTVTGDRGKCEAASSTARGFNIDAWFNVYATTTPREDTSL